MAFRSKLIPSSKILFQNHGNVFSALTKISSGASPCLIARCASTGKGKDVGVVDDQPTHTGQVFDKDDYRLVRFINKKKEVNEQIAIKLIDEAPPKPEEDRVIWCDGGGGPTGHPRVYINLDPQGNHICGYCGLRFYKKDHH